MKLVIAGSTGFLATQLIRQAITYPGVTSVVALGRREASLPAGIDSHGKFRSVICKDFENYSEDVKSELAEADACIWTIAITPGKLRSVSWEEVCKISRDYAVTAVETISQLRRDRQASYGQYRFLYVSGATATRDPAKKPLILPNYSVMRGEAENLILKCAVESKGALEACIAKPGLIEDKENTGFFTRVAKDYGRRLFGVPKVSLQEMAAALLHEAVNGFEKETLENEDLVRIGAKALAAQTSS
ncbi:hypothetical protein NPX13_g2796 [Xylaria arbuscula]|uniref:NAD(P)-binding domain-containing protein n=1 Tax=Xylaria arbuscula TaxID=114810 RepID=A0A9W8NJE8_9PEZI|nr:hypothetical protein NPX13_g2796 [Xylaria arbuscula]